MNIKVNIGPGLVVVHTDCRNSYCCVILLCYLVSKTEAGYSPFIQNPDKGRWRVGKLLHRSLIFRILNTGKQWKFVINQ